MNIQFNYLYRDGSNYKKFGNVIFSNTTNIPFSDIENYIKSNLIDGEFFIASDWALPELFFEVTNDDDHNWHEFYRIEEANTADKPQEDILCLIKIITPNF